MRLWRAVGRETCAYVVLSVQPALMKNTQGLLFVQVSSDNKSSDKFRTMLFFQKGSSHVYLFTTLQKDL